MDRLLEQNHITCVRDAMMRQEETFKQQCLHGSFDVFSKMGKEQLKAVKELQESLKILKGYLAGKKFFGGEIIGLVDIVAGWIPSWFCIIEEIVGIKIINEQELPLLCIWIHCILDLDVVKESMPPLDKVKAYMSNIREGCWLLNSLLKTSL